jgi:predicted DNA-binding ribbon-helix-helix protein
MKTSHNEAAPALDASELLTQGCVRRSIVIAGRKTSVTLEDAFWKALKEIATERGMTASELVAAINSERQHANLSSAVRVFVLDFYRGQKGPWIGKKAESALPDEPDTPTR